MQRSFTRKPTIFRKRTRIVTRSTVDKNKDQDDAVSSFAEILSLLKTDPTIRTQNSLRKLETLTENVPFFVKIRKEYDDTAHLNCCQYMRYQFLNKGDYVFHFGDDGDLFYIIIYGSVKVLVPTPTPHNEYLLTEVSTLETGSAFGELALIKNQPRAASILCAEDTHFATLNKKDYLKILGEHATRKLEDLVKFLSSLPAFEKWNLSQLVKLSYYFTQATYKRKQIIYKEGAEADNVYIVRRGEVQLCKELELKASSPTRLDAHGRPIPIIKSYKKRCEANIAIKAQGEIFGDEEIIKDIPRITTCKCFSDTTILLVISKLEFKRRIRKEESLTHFTEKYKLQEQTRDRVTSAISGIKIRDMSYTLAQKSRESLDELNFFSIDLEDDKRSTVTSLKKLSPTPEALISTSRTPTALGSAGHEFFTENSLAWNNNLTPRSVRSTIPSPLSWPKEKFDLSKNRVRRLNLKIKSQRELRCDNVKNMLRECSILGGKGRLRRKL